MADTTYRPIVQAASHPIDTVSALGNAIAHPISTGIAVKNAVVDTVSAAASGDPHAVGEVTGTLVSAAATGGALKAASSLVKGAEVAEVATTTSKVEQIVNSIDEGGFKVTANAKSAGQEANVTITHPSEAGAKLNLRSESHPLPGSGGQSVPHVNVERVTPRTATSPKKIANTRITQ